MKVEIKKEGATMLGQTLHVMELPFIPRIGENLVFEEWNDDEGEEKEGIVSAVVYDIDENDMLSRVVLFVKY